MFLDKKIRLILEGWLSSGASRAVAAFAPLITTPLLISYLGEKSYGLWMVLISISNVLAVSDFGITNGVTNRLVVSKGKEKNKLIVQCYVLLIVIGFVLFLICSGAIAFYYFAKAEQDIDAFRNAKLAFAVLIPFAVSIPLNFVLRLYLVDGKAVLANLIPLISAILSVVIVYAVVALRLDDFWVVFWFSMVGNVLMLCAAYYYSRINKFELDQIKSRPDFSAFKEIIGSGRKYFYVTMMILVLAQVDYYIVLSYLGPEDVVPYSIANRLISIANVSVGMLGATMWPILTESLRNGEIEWVKKAILKVNSIVLGAYLIIGGLGLVSYDYLINLWLGKALVVSSVTLFLLVSTAAVIAYLSPYFAVLNSLAKIDVQIKAYGICLFVTLPLKVLACYKYGMDGMVIAGFLGWSIVMLPIVRRAALSELANKSR